MIKVVVGNNVEKRPVIVDETRTLRSVLEENEIEYSKGMMHLDGSALKAGELDKTFADFGIKEKCFLLSVVKTDNALK